MNAILSEKGQITIPKELRDQLGLKPGTVLEFQSREGKLLAWKKVDQDLFEKWRGRGTLLRSKSVDAYLKRARHGHGG